MEKVDIAIIGGGPAGLMASIEAAQAGANIVMIDGREMPGGNYYKKYLYSTGSKDGLIDDQDKKELFEMVDGANRLKIRFLNETTVWGVFRDARFYTTDKDQFPTYSVHDPSFTLALQGPNEVDSIEARSLIIAPGVYDRIFPFPGWTLPGVMSLGGAQLLLKEQGWVPGKRILVAGTGPLLLAVAADLSKAGADIVALVDTSSLLDGWQSIYHFLFGNIGKLIQGFKYWQTLRKYKVPLLFRHAVFHVIGESSVQAAIVGKVDNVGHPIEGTERTYTVDTVCLGFGFLPLSELALQLGCSVHYDTDLRTFLPNHDERMETSVPYVFVAGDITGLGGKNLARLQGQIAGIAACGKLGFLSNDSVINRIKMIYPKLKTEMQFRNALWHQYRMRSGLLDLIDEDTIVCRCEAVHAGIIREAIKEGTIDINGIKRRTRVGMGLCQGRFCGSIVSELIAKETGLSHEDLLPLNTRPPALPVRLRDIINNTNAEKVK